MLSRAGIDVRAVATEAGAVSLHPGNLEVEVSLSIAEFDVRHPDGADVVIVPAVMEPEAVDLEEWLRSQAARGALLMSVCDGAMVLAHGGFLDGPPATAHWYSRDDLADRYPEVQWQDGQRLVVSDGVVTTTGVSAALPASVHLVERLAGPQRAREVARALSAPYPDLDHDGAAFRLEARHVGTLVWNWLRFWRREQVAIPVAEGVDEVTLALAVDALARTGLARPILLGPAGRVTTAGGLILSPVTPRGSLDADRTESLPPPGRPPLDHVLAGIEAHYGRGTADFVALQLEYPRPGLRPRRLAASALPAEPSIGLEWERLARGLAEPREPGMGGRFQKTSVPPAPRSGPDGASAWARLDATAQAALVKRGDASAEELVRAAMERIERVDPALGAVPVRSFERALAWARALGPAPRFAGVPFLMKDVGARQAGQPYFAGNRALRDAGHRAVDDTPLGARFRDLGLVTLGNSSTPEFGLQSNTWPLAYGPVRNPWDPSRAAGGSSGGACAAVAAGLVPVAHASDGAGSIRIPAAWCGLIGLKPSRDRIVWRHAGKQRADVEFVVARSLRDTVDMLDLLRPGRARRTSRSPFRKVVERADPSPRLRVGVTTRCPADVPVEASHVEAVDAAAAALSDLGHAVETSAPASLYEYEERALHGAVLGPLEYRECLDELAERLGRSVDASDVEPFLWELAQLGHAAGDESEVTRAAEWARAWTGRTLGWFDDYDLLLTPTVPEPAPRLASLDPERLTPLELLERMVPHMAFTEPWNATGQPAISLPLASTPEGLPVGVQVVAAPEREDLLLRVAADLLAASGAPALPRVHA